METWWNAVLVLTVATAVKAIPLDPWSLQDTAIAAAIDVYNNEQGTGSLYKRADDPLSGEPSYSAQLRFRIKETVCSKTDNKRPEECDFKGDGIVKDCIVSGTGNKVVTCTNVQPKKTHDVATQAGKGDNDTGKGAGKEISKSGKFFKSLLNKFLVLIGLKDSADDSEPICWKCIFDVFS
ncbi:cathelicidin antimicrobial peptide-like [Ambystoma mexicanum]|uniref:cathelicidin antimicrobial peptide-like n=1 Tax=Ambystoma mexicanum TaxID=8296 RepID=UPI0037E724E7